MNRCYIGIGSNIGDKEGYIKKSISKLEDSQGIRVIRSASLYQTAPWGNTEQDWFLNTVAEIESDLKPLELLKILLSIENDLGRVRKEKWGPRVIDLDLLLFGSDTIKLPQLEVPHPRMADRAFVLVPLLELNPKLILSDGRVGQDLLKLLLKDQEIKLYNK